MSRAAQVSMLGWVSGTVPAAEASAWQRLMTAIHRWHALLDIWYMAVEKASASFA